MESSFNFRLVGSKPLSKSSIDKGLTHYNTLCNFIQSLPYGRNTDRSDYRSVLKENKGTCSTKHAFLKQVAIEQDASQIQFCLGIYKMNENNTKGVGLTLSEYKLDYIPEAHTYLKFNGNIFDFTRPVKSNSNFEEQLLFEELIMPEQIGSYKINRHKTFLKHWLISENTPYTLEEIWRIREVCIAQLSA